MVAEVEHAEAMVVTEVDTAAPGGDITVVLAGSMVVLDRPWVDPGVDADRITRITDCTPMAVGACII